MSTGLPVLSVSTMRPHKGFSLLEILVAFAIMAVALTIVLRIFGSGVNNARISEEYSLAVQIAESIMVRTGVETQLQVGETSGTEADKYAWWVRITPVTGPPPKSRPRFKSQQETPDQPGLKLMAVHVRVGWVDRADQQRTVELNTLRLVQEPAS